MSLIATSVEASGVARIFFDMRTVAPLPDEERQIAEAIERAFVLAAANGKAPRSGRDE